MQLKLQETIVLDAAAGVRETRDGYLVASPRVARTGIQVYRGSELGEPTRDQVRVYRPEDEVMHKDALVSLAFRPITLDHPPDMVDASNWRKYAVGQVGGDIARDGEFIRASVALMDRDAIREVRAGKSELSLGYTSDLDWTPGTAPGGGAYDAVQRNIRINHLAVVDAARGGPNLRIGDSEMTTKTIIVDGVPVEVTDVAAAVIQRALAAKDAEVEELKEDLEEEEAAKKKIEEEDKKSKDSIAAKDAELTTLKSQLADATNPAKIEQATRDRATVIEKGKHLLGDALVVDGKSNAEIHRQVVDAKLKDAAKGWTDAQIDASFAALTAGVQVEDRLASALSASPQGGTQSTKAYDAYVKNLGDAWKTPAAA